MFRIGLTFCCYQIFDQRIINHLTKETQMLSVINKIHEALIQSSLELLFEAELLYVALADMEPAM